MKKISFLFVIIVLVIGGIAAWWINSTMPVNPFDQTKREFTIQKGQGIRDIANELKEEGLIKDAVAFFLIVKQLGLDDKIQAGKFRLAPAMSSYAIANALQKGTFDEFITIPEGKRSEEIAQILSEHLPTYEATWDGRLKANEGYLFPDTYSFTKDADIDYIITTMRETFDKKYATIPPGRNSNLSQAEVVNIAALVEREAKFPEDRPLVASVILNRLNAHMVLNIDASIQYALGYQPNQKTWWKKELSLDDLEIASPYNTYKTQGLPPTPIANPGLESLTAVVDAPDTDYYYYVSDSTGKNHYAKTLEEHNKNIEKYNVK
jgi:UPF0755 protein